MECPSEAAGAQAERQRWLFTFKVDGDLRFISHHDTLRMLRRALVRTGLPIRYSEGFNPHPRMSIPLPRPVGIASHAEAVVVEFDRAIEGDAAVDSLASQCPSGMEMTGARRLGLKERVQPDLVRYDLELDAEAGKTADQRVSEILAASEVMLQRVRHADRRVRSVDVRPYLVDLSISGLILTFTTRVTNTGTVKPAEVAGLFGMDIETVNHRIRRLEVQWIQELRQDETEHDGETGCDDAKEKNRTAPSENE